MIVHHIYSFIPQEQACNKPFNSFAGQFSSVIVLFDLWFCIKKNMSFALFNVFRNVNLICMERFSTTSVAIIHVSIPNTKRRYIICITNIKLHCNKIIPSIKHVTEYMVIIEADICMFEIAMFFMIILIKTLIIFNSILFI